MKILNYRCENYKAFQESTRIELRPLTLFFGKNNSGKSTLLRLPRLIIHALADRVRGGFPVKVDGLSFADRFRDMIYGSLAHGAASFGVEVEEAGERLDINATIQNIQDLTSVSGQKEFCLVSRLTIQEPQIHLQWEPKHSAIPFYTGMGELQFRGMWPVIGSGHAQSSAWSFMKTWQERFQSLEEQVSHLGPVRDEIPRVFEVHGDSQIGLGGLGAIFKLGQDRDLLELVSVWFKNHMDGWGISIDYAGSAYRCLLKRGEVSVNLADAGQGIQQVLPVVVQQLFHRVEGGGAGGIDLVEQPELHLHAAAHAPLGDLFLDSAKQGQYQVVVETHSENILLRIRRRIAEGFDASMVALYYVVEQADGPSSVRRIRILQDGSVDWWPEGVFSEGYEELKALSRVQHRAKQKA